MFVVVGLVLLIAALVVGVTGVLTNADSAHTLTNHFSVFGGLGVSLMQTRHVHLGFQLLGGGRFYAWDTSEGFSNTLFPAAGYVLGRFEGGFRF